jgi:hypothetical protein
MDAIIKAVAIDDKNGLPRGSKESPTQAQRRNG